MEENEVPNMNTILYHITMEQAEKIANYYGKELNYLQDYEICELLDRLIDEV